ncbi:MAG: dihydrolipoamide dehydrogenase [delta proteobacterium ML8_F1]|nr:MAG: dihydrolipoamide dehydrogenase [delta proteobacterium ML8_F1]
MKIAVIGGGPGGYVAAIKAAQLGAEVTLVEKKWLGGTCLNVGCIPTKVLLHTAEILDHMKNASLYGIEVPAATINWEQVLLRKKQVVDQLVGGVEGLLRSNGVNIVNGRGELLDTHRMKIHLPGGATETLDFDYCIVATGSEPSTVPLPGMDSEGVIDSDEALSLAEIPESLVVIGGGVIGSEFAQVYSNFGSKVTVVEMASHILPTFDEELSEIIHHQLTLQGVDLITDARVLEILPGDRLSVKVSRENREFVIEGSKVLVAVGRRAVISGIGLKTLGIELDRGFVKVNDRMKTTVENIYAIGDCNGRTMLAHVASAQGIVAVEDIFKKRVAMDFRTIPYAVYTHPEIAAVGLTEAQARAQGYQVKVGRFPLSANGKTLIVNQNGLVKIVADTATKEILGCQIVGPRATDLIGIIGVAIRLEATVEELLSTIQAHPTISEALTEAAHDVFEHPIHLPI